MTVDLGHAIIQPMEMNSYESLWLSKEYSMSGNVVEILVTAEVYTT